MNVIVNSFCSRHLDYHNNLNRHVKAAKGWAILSKQLVASALIVIVACFSWFPISDTNFLSRAIYWADWPLYLLIISFGILRCNSRVGRICPLNIILCITFKSASNNKIVRNFSTWIFPFDFSNIMETPLRYLSSGILFFMARLII